MPGFFHHRDPAGTGGCHGDDFMAEGSDALLDRLVRVMKEEFHAKMLERVVASSLKSSFSIGHCAGMCKR